MTTDDALWIAPPEWVHILDVPGWIIKQSDPADERFRPKIVLELIRAVRSGKLIHRVADIRIDSVSGKYPNGLGSSEYRPYRLIVGDWEASAPDWSTGTVGGWRGHDGQRERHRIELWWHSVDPWAHDKISLWRMDSNREAKRATIQAEVADSAANLSAVNEEPEATQRPASKEAAGTNIGGRPAKYDWVSFVREIVRLANTIDGLPGRAAATEHMKLWCIATWGTEPADSTLREKISELWPNNAPET